MPLLTCHKTLDQLREERNAVQKRLNLARANITGNRAIVSATIQGLYVALNRLDHAIAAATSDPTPNPPGAAAMKAVHEARE